MVSLTCRVGVALCASLFLIDGPARAQDARPEPPVVSVIGASVSAGFVDPKPGPDGEPNSTVKLARAMRVLWDDGEVRVSDRSDVATFLGPVRRQGRHVDRAVEDGAVVTVAIDFLFWFGYGRAAGDERDARVALQQQGFALLDKIEGPILVGDYPDMTGADPRMISPRQIPSAEVLAELNRRLAAWAAERDQVTVFPLAGFVTDAKGDGIPVRHDGVELLLQRDVLLQGDGLHATRLGSAVLTDAVATALREILPAGSAARPLERALGEIAEGTGSLLLLDELVAAARDEVGVGR